GFGDHPDAGLGPVRAQDDPADVVAVDRDRSGLALLRFERRRADDDRARRKRRQTKTESKCGYHAPILPLLVLILRSYSLIGVAHDGADPQSARIHPRGVRLYPGTIASFAQ